MREVFDHNDLERIPSAAESDAIKRLYKGIEMAAKELWGPDLAVKAFCDLDKVFFCGRLRGHVCLTWRSKDTSGRGLFGWTPYLTGGKCVIEMFASEIFRPGPKSYLFQMFETLLHEMT